ncbi:AAA+ ATPase domain-containing protein, partial [Tanacetum coccineum]
MAATANEPPPLDDILDDSNPRRLMELLDKYKDATTAEEANLRLDKLFKSNPDKFFLKLALIFKSSTSETRLEMLTHLHNFLMRNKGCLKSDTYETIKDVLLDKVQCEESVDILESLCNIISDVASISNVWGELVKFIDKSLNITSVGENNDSRHEKVCLDIIAKQPQVLSNVAQHEAISKSFFQLLSSKDHDTRILAVKATIQLVGCLETKNRNPYKKLIPKFIPVLHYMAKDPGPKKQTSVVGNNQNLVDRYIDAAKLFQTLLEMNDIGFFVTDEKHLTSFIKCLLKIGGTKLCWLHLRHSCLRLAANFCKHQSIDMRSYYLEVYKILINMLIEVEEELDRWYDLKGDDVEGTTSDYTAAKALLDEFIPAIGVQAFLTAVRARMEFDLETGDWHLKNGVIVIVTKLAIGLNNENEGGRAPPYITLQKLLELASKPIGSDNHRLQWTSANAIATVGDLIKVVHPSMIKKVSREVIAKLDGVTTEIAKIQAEIKLAQVIFSTQAVSLLYPESLVRGGNGLDGKVLDSGLRTPDSVFSLRNKIGINILVFFRMHYLVKSTSIYLPVSRICPASLKMVVQNSLAQVRLTEPARVRAQSNSGEMKRRLSDATHLIVRIAFVNEL